MEDVQAKEKGRQEAILIRTDSQAQKQLAEQQKSNQLVKQILLKTKSCENNKMKLMRERQKEIQYNCLYKVQIAQEKYSQQESQKRSRENRRRA